jgi:hypothetical protein
MDPQQTRSFKRLRHQSDPSQASTSDAPASPASLQFDLTTLTSRQLALSTRTEEEAFAMAVMLGIVSLEPGNRPPASTCA